MTSDDTNLLLTAQISGRYKKLSKTNLQLLNIFFHSIAKRAENTPKKQLEGKLHNLSIGGLGIYEKK
jgi:hypothetical protein